MEKWGGDGIRNKRKCAGRTHHPVVHTPPYDCVAFLLEDVDFVLNGFDPVRKLRLLDANSALLFRLPEVHSFSPSLGAGLGATPICCFGFGELAEERGLDIVTFRDWQKIEQAEQAAARDGAPREKFVDIESMIAAKS